MAERAHVLIVHDRRERRDALRRRLEQAGYRASALGHDAGLRPILADGSVDLTLLEVRPPARGSTALCRELGELLPPVIMLAPKGVDESERLLALELCADDFLVEPLDPRELLARIRAVLRRTRPEAAAQPARVRRFVRFDGWRVDTATGALSRARGPEVALSAGELELLLAFLNFPRTALSREQLLDLTRGPSVMLYDRSIDVQVSRLRKKLRCPAGDHRLIRTLRGRGYLFAADVEYE